MSRNIRSRINNSRAHTVHKDHSFPRHPDLENESVSDKSQKTVVSMMLNNMRNSKIPIGLKLLKQDSAITTSLVPGDRSALGLSSSRQISAHA